MKRVLKWVWRIIELLIVLYVVSITSLILFRNRFGYTQIDKTTLVTVNKDNISNLGNVKERDLLLVKDSGTNSINAGDEIYYYATINNQYVIKRGVVASFTADDTKAVYILNDEDKTSVSSTRVMGKYSATYNSFGGTLEFLQSRVGFLIFVLLPILLIFIYQIYDLVISFKFAPKETIVEEKKKTPKEIVQKPLDDSKETIDDDIEVL